MGFKIELAIHLSKDKCVDSCVNRQFAGI